MIQIKKSENSKFRKTTWYNNLLAKSNYTSTLCELLPRNYHLEHLFIKLPLKATANCLTLNRTLTVILTPLRYISTKNCHTSYFSNQQ